MRVPGTDEWKKAEKLLRRREGDIERGLPILPKLGLIRFDEAVTMLTDDFELNNQSTLDDAKADRLASEARLRRSRARYDSNGRDRRVLEEAA